MAAKTVCLGEALPPEFRDYAQAVVANARVLATGLQARGFDVVTGGTDTHIVLLDCRRQGLKGNEAADRLERRRDYQQQEHGSIRRREAVDHLRLATRLRRRHQPRIRPRRVSGVLRTSSPMCWGNPDSKLRGAREQVARLCDNYPLYRT